MLGLEQRHQFQRCRRGNDFFNHTALQLKKGQLPAPRVLLIEVPWL
jgi:hypothetical protein